MQRNKVQFLTDHCSNMSNVNYKYVQFFLKQFRKEDVDDADSVTPPKRLQLCEEIRYSYCSKFMQTHPEFLFMHYVCYLCVQLFLYTDATSQLFYYRLRMVIFHQLMKGWNSKNVPFVNLHRWILFNFGKK